MLTIEALSLSRKGKRQLSVRFGFSFLAVGYLEHNLLPHAGPQAKGGEFSVHAGSHLPDGQLPHGGRRHQPPAEASALRQVESD